MLTCQKCGRTEIDPSARYCAGCGKPLAMPEPKPESGPRPRIRGLLLVPAIALCICPLINLLLLMSGHEGGCGALIYNFLIETPSTLVMDAYAKISTMVLLVLTVLAAVLFFTRNSKAPLACLTLFALYAVDNLVLAFWMKNVSFAEYETVSMVTAKFLFWGVMAYFWWGYISVSARVRETFVN
jgi:hypothetical protein